MNHNPPLHIQDLGLIGYSRALEQQRTLNQAVIDGEAPPTVLLLEHPPVITLTRRAAPNLLADPTSLRQLGIDTADTDRGGDITYHGPGQLVVYPILKLADFGLNLSSYMRLLERAVIQTLSHFGMEGHTECGATGVWINPEVLAGDVQRAGPYHQPLNRSAKICAMGVRIRKNTTMHGLALNIAPDMSHFDLIVPCGLAGRPVVSMRQLLGAACPTLQEVKGRLVDELQDCLRNRDGSVSCPNGSARGRIAGS